MAPINIRGNIIDPAAQPVSDGFGWRLPATAEDTKYVLVQLDREMDNSIAAGLEEHEASIIKRMTGNTWLLYYPPNDLRVLETVPGVEKALVYVSNFVVQSNLRPDPAAGSSPDPVTVSIYLHEHSQANTDSTLARIQSISTSCIVKTVSEGVIHVEVDPNDLSEIAKIDSVQAIEEVPEAVPLNDRVREICGINKISQTLLPGESMLTGEGQCIGMADSGVDAKHEAFTDPSGKIAGSWYLYGIEDDDWGHGTHVAATMLGSPVKGWQGQNINGVAPSASLSVQGGLFRGQNWVATAFFDQAYSTTGVACRIHNNSYGKTMGTPHVQAPYTTADAEKVDQWALAHPDFLIVYSAGNEGQKQTPTGGQVGAWATAKNVLTVGATFTDRPFRDDYAVDYSGITTQRVRDTVTAFSSRGPVVTSGRTKPDIVAPGAGVLSARASNSTAVRKQAPWPLQFGSPPKGYSPGDQTIFCSGTSMSAPAVSGCAALLREALMKWQDVLPSAPLMKALLINGTNDLKQDKQLQGYGQVDMEKVLAPVRQKASDITAGTISSGYIQDTFVKRDTSTRLFKATASTPSSPDKAIAIQITLVYHDYQGDTIQNRMSLSVEYNGSVTETAVSQQLENVHRVRVEQLSAGDVVSITVKPGFLNNDTPWAIAWNQVEI